MRGYSEMITDVSCVGSEVARTKKRTKKKNSQQHKKFNSIVNFEYSNSSYEVYLYVQSCDDT